MRNDLKTLAAILTVGAIALSAGCVHRHHHHHHDYDHNPPGPVGGPGTNWENPPGPVGGPGASPNRRHWR